MKEGQDSSQEIPEKKTWFGKVGVIGIFFSVLALVFYLGIRTGMDSSNKAHTDSHGHLGDVNARLFDDYPQLNALLAEGWESETFAIRTVEHLGRMKNEVATLQRLSEEATQKEKEYFNLLPSLPSTNVSFNWDWTPGKESYRHKETGKELKEIVLVFEDENGKVKGHRIVKGGKTVIGVVYHGQSRYHRITKLGKNKVLCEEWWKDGNRHEFFFPISISIRRTIAINKKWHFCAMAA